jgi:hypothetical protein
MILCAHKALTSGAGWSVDGQLQWVARELTADEHPTTE